MRKSLYAIPCAFGSQDDYDEDSFFFLTFKTKDEVKAMALAGCVCGNDKAENSLLILTEDGEIYQL